MKLRGHLGGKCQYPHEVFALCPVLLRAQCGLQCELCQGPMGGVAGRVLHALGTKLSVL